MILKRILLTVDSLFKVNFQRSSSLGILICTYTWMWSFLYKIHILYIHRQYIIYMHYIYYIYLKYIFMCVCVYIFISYWSIPTLVCQGPLYCGVGVHVLPLSMDCATNPPMPIVKQPQHCNAGLHFANPLEGSVLLFCKAINLSCEYFIEK